MPTPTYPRYVDPRATRFGGILTGTAALVAAGLQEPWTALALSLVLLVSAIGGPPWNLWGQLYRWTLRRRLGPADFLEPAAPPRFANLLGGGVALAGGLLALSGFALVGFGLVGLVSALAFLNGIGNFCVGCRLYGLLVRPREPPLKTEA